MSKNIQFLARNVSILTPRRPRGGGRSNNYARRAQNYTCWGTPDLSEMPSVGNRATNQMARPLETKRDGAWTFWTQPCRARANVAVADMDLPMCSCLSLGPPARCGPGPAEAACTHALVQIAWSDDPLLFARSRPVGATHRLSQVRGGRRPQDGKHVGSYCQPTPLYVVPLLRTCLSAYRMAAWVCRPRAPRASGGRPRRRRRRRGALPPALALARACWCDRDGSASPM